ncbi:hypothetical protein BDW22DRAFT_1408908 [Trametopsis cervina]|nr:hypothetical protein BDW22DRAFT_1408908 [Trametopsis cervina]
MQPPTCTRMRVRHVHDAQVILHAVAEGKLPMVRRRLDDEERLALRPGHIYVWEERSSNPLESNSLESIQRFTDGRSWGPSKAREDFLLYHEKEGTSRASIIQRSNGLEAMRLVKQTYSAFVDGPNNSRKWHLNAYYTSDTLELLRTIDQFPELRSINVPPGRYVCARSSNVRRGGRNRQSPDEDDGTTPSPRQASSSTAHHSPRSMYRGETGEVVLALPPAQAQANLPGIMLAPLQYLENITPRLRDPVDDEQLRSLRHGISANL